MSKVSNALITLALLKSRGKMTRDEIAKEIECDKREVSRYKEDLAIAGVNIKEIRGRYGGYVLEGKDYLLSLDLNDAEYAALNMALEQLKQEQVLFLGDMNKALIKINALKDKHEEISNSKYYIKSSKHCFDYEKERKMWLDINAAIITNKKIYLKYGNANTEVKERIVRPYALYQYKGAMYFVGFCELKNDLRQFKISRIKDYVISEDEFEKDRSFNLEEYLNGTFGIYKDEEIQFKIKVYYPAAQIVKEQQWVENEEIEENEERKFIIYKAKMYGKTEIKSWILSMGSNAEVLEPESFKKEIEEELKKTLEIYK